MRYSARITKLFEVTQGLAGAIEFEFVDSIDFLSEFQLQDPTIIYLYLEI